MEQPSSVKKTSSSSSCSSWKDSKPLPKELTKLVKKVEKAGRRLFHNEKNPTFVPSAIQNGAESSSSQETGVPPPYPVDNSFGSGFPPLPAASSSSQPTIPPSYGWALNGVSSSESSSMALSLDIGEGNETAGMGFDHVGGNFHDDDYIHVPEHEARPKREAQNAKLEEVNQRLLKEKAYLNLLLTDDSEINSFFRQNYAQDLVDADVEDLEREVAMLEKQYQQIREMSPYLPPLRPPPPRSTSQDNSSRCARCHVELPPNEYRCLKCSLPCKKIDPVESSICCCKYCC